METLLYDGPSLAYGIGTRRIFEMTNSRSDRLIEYARGYLTATSSMSDTPVVPRQPVPPDTDGIPGTDIRLVSEQAEVTIEQALDTLKRHNGDIVNSIMDLIRQQR